MLIAGERFEIILSHSISIQQSAISNCMIALRLYDRARTPRSWTEIIRPGQFVAFAKLIDTGAPCDAEGRAVSLLVRLSSRSHRAVLPDAAWDESRRRRRAAAAVERIVRTCRARAKAAAR
jgi:hypothetical protein